MHSNKESSSIKDFFAGKSIFITGGTGFMGRVLIEKLLRSCPGVEKIYVLLRPKKGKDIHERLKYIYDNELFAKYLTEYPDGFREKVIPIAGDVTEINLGISIEDRRVLEENVDIVFHSAASVRFTDPLKNNIIMNTRGTRDLVALAENMKKLKVLIHVSTAYANTDKNPINEEVFAPHADWRKTIQIAETLDDFALKAMTSKYIEPLPNTYVFTKNLAEHIMYEHKDKLPIVIFRPSVVISSLFDPIPGWIDNFNGPLGLSVGIGKGILHALNVKSDNPLSKVPVDLVIRSMIVAAWERGIRSFKEDDGVTVIHCSDAGVKLNIGEYSIKGIDTLNNVPLNDPIWQPSCSITTNKFLYFIMIIFFHVVPAILMDAFLRLSGSQPVLLKLQRKIYAASIILEYYTQNNWIFIDKHFVAMCDRIPEHERNDFQYIFEDIDITKYLENAFLGCRRYLLKEPDDTLDHAKVYFRRIVLFSSVVRVLFWSFMFWFFIRSSVFRAITNRTSEMLTSFV